MKININIDKILSKNKEELKKDMLTFATVVKNEVDKNTPEDTKTLLGNNQISNLKEEENKVSIKVYNDTEYAPYVEFGVGLVYNYNKPKGNIFYSGVGVAMFGRAWQKLKNKYN